MASKNVIFSHIILAILILMASGKGAFSMSSDHSMTNPQFRPIEQPLAPKAIVTLGGLGLIGLELWWFLWSQPKTQNSKSEEGIQAFNITVEEEDKP